MYPWLPLSARCPFSEIFAATVADHIRYQDTNAQLYWVEALHQTVGSGDEPQPTKVCTLRARGNLR